MWDEIDPKSTRVQNISCLSRMVASNVDCRTRIAIARTLLDGDQWIEGLSRNIVRELLVTTAISGSGNFHHTDLPTSTRESNTTAIVFPNNLMQPKRWSETSSTTNNRLRWWSGTIFIDPFLPPFPIHRRPRHRCCILHSSSHLLFAILSCFQSICYTAMVGCQGETHLTLIRKDDCLRDIPCWGCFLVLNEARRSRGNFVSCDFACDDFLVSKSKG